MLMRFTITNAQSAEQTDAYLEEAEITMVQNCTMPDMGQTHRQLRGKQVTGIGLRGGLFYFTGEGFDSVMARLFSTRGQLDQAAAHREAARNGAAKSGVIV